jgi:hypothetical protein
MIRQWSLPLGLMIAAACVATPTWALDASTPAPKSAQKTPAAPAVDPSALHAIDLMAQKLRTLTAFTVNADLTTEEVLDSGQKVSYGGTVTYKIRAPDKFFAALDSDRKQRSFYHKLFRQPGHLRCSQSASLTRQASQARCPRMRAPCCDLRVQSQVGFNGSGKIMNEPGFQVSAFTVLQPETLRRKIE